MLIKELIRRQKAENMSDAQMAALLGVTKWQWYRLHKPRPRQRARAIPLAVVLGAVRAWPDLGAMRVIELIGDEQWQALTRSPSGQHE